MGSMYLTFARSDVDMTLYTEPSISDCITISLHRHMNTRSWLAYGICNLPTAESVVRVLTKLCAIYNFSLTILSNPCRSFALVNFRSSIASLQGKLCQRFVFFSIFSPSGCALVVTSTGTSSCSQDSPIAVVGQQDSASAACWVELDRKKNSNSTSNNNKRKLASFQKLLFQIRIS